ncbi:MAG: Mur ligase family protein, partial [Betaproteobacteria bacterium]
MVKDNEKTMDPALRRTFRFLRDGIGWRLKRLIGDQASDRFFIEMARRWRPLVNKALFVGIAGSAAKTTTKELAVGILARQRRVIGNPLSLNSDVEVANTILRVRRNHDFCIAELDEQRPGAMDEPLALLQPSIGIVTVIENDHWTAFQSREAIAAEVG